MQKFNISISEYLTQFHVSRCVWETMPWRHLKAFMELNTKVEQLQKSFIPQQVKIIHVFICSNIHCGFETQIVLLWYVIAGGSHDWAKGVAGIKFSYCYELRDQGRHGFTLPAHEITPTGTETFAAVRSMADDIMAFYNMTTPSESTSFIQTKYSGQ